MTEGVEAPWGTSGFAERFREVVRRIPDHVALSDLKERTTFAALGGAAATTAMRISSSVLPPGPVLVTGDRLASFATAFLSAILAGRATVVVPPHLSAAAIDVAAARTGAALIIGEPNDGRTNAAIPHLAPSTASTRGADVLPLIDTAIGTTGTWSEVVTLANTSGSTGEPKLVVQRRSLAWGAFVPEFDRLATDVRLAANLSLSSAFRFHVATAAIMGSGLVGFPLDRLPPGELLDRLAGEGITGLFATPSVIRRLHLAARGRPALPEVRSVISVGEALRWADVTRVRELCGPDVTVFNRYGSTEAGRVAERAIAPDESTGDGPVDVGHSCTGRHVWIERDDGDVAAPDEIGRIVIEGPFTTEGFALEDLGEGIARFRSGDLGRIDTSGALWLEGRADRMVKVAGMRVEPGAVEDVLQGVPGVLEVAVLPTPVGDSEVRLVAHVVVGEDGPDVDMLRRATAEQVTPVAVPVRFHVRRDPLPLLASGKVDGLALTASST